VTLTIVILVLSLYIVGLSSFYLLFKREKIKGWGIPMKIAFYWGFILCSIIIIWEIVATVIKHI
jgi:hypothetical protein